MGSGPVKAARLSLREAFKVIACCLKTALFMPLKAAENRKEDKVSVQSYWHKPRISSKSFCSPWWELRKDIDSQEKGNARDAEAKN